ncbi:MAG: hypothetical protein ACO1SV_05790 [Fimbriimonas sp.]
MPTLFLSSLFLTVTMPQLPSGGTEVVERDAHLTTPVAGLERTGAEAKVIAVAGQPFSKALRITVRRASPETNYTQLTLANAQRVASGDVMLASFWLRGAAEGAKRPGRVEFLFERSQNPWTKSVTQGAAAGASWRRVLVPFRAAEAYAPGEAMASLRVAFGPQTVEIGGFTLTNYGTSRDVDSLRGWALTADPLGEVRVRVNRKDVRQTMLGLGGNFCQPRYGATEPLDGVGRYVLDHLKVVHARIGLPLNHWNPRPGVYRNDAQARASLLALKEVAQRRIPTVVSVWEGPEWMLPGRPEATGKRLPADRYDECIEAIARYLVLARDEYGVAVDYFSFNEPDFGVNFKFTSEEMKDFIRQAGRRFQALRLKTKFLVGDTANGGAFAAYAEPILADRTLAPYLGPLAFHSWDALSASDAAYLRIAELGRKYKKPVWCLEAGHDAQLWHARDPWGTWDNGFLTAQAYVRTINLTRATLMDYWTYQDNYPLVDKKGLRPYPVFNVMRQMEEILSAGARVVGATSSREDLHVLATVQGRRFGVLMVNPSGRGRVTLTGLPGGANVRIVTSDRNGQGRSDRMARRVDARGEVVVNLPARSVVSVLGG